MQFIKIILKILFSINTIFLTSCSLNIFSNCDQKHFHHTESIYEYKINQYGNAISWQLDTFPIPILISPEFNKLEQQGIKQGIEFWNEKVGYLVFIPIMNLSNKYYFSPKAITITKYNLHKKCGTQILGLTTRNLYKNKSKIPLYYNSAKIKMHPENENDLSYLRTVVHELGHALGMGHDSDSLSVMYPIILKTSWVIQKTDLEFVRKSMGHDPINPNIICTTK